MIVTRIVSITRYCNGTKRGIKIVLSILMALLTYVIFNPGMKEVVTHLILVKKVASSLLSYGQLKKSQKTNLSCLSRFIHIFWLIYQE